VVTRSWKQAFIGLIPNVVPLSIAVWVFSLFGFSLNILTAITATVCIGLLDDDTVHLLYRKFVLREPVDTLANSIVNTAILLAVGFGFFVLSDFYPTQVFGGVSALVFVFGILGELTLFQVVMDWIQLKTREK
jgi:predicted RND superfamily exporter protein